MEKVYLFDVVSKTYLATDSSPIDMQNYAICSDMIDVYIDISCIYGWATTLMLTSCVSYREQKADDWVNDINSESIIKLADSTILYLKQVEKWAKGYLAIYWKWFKIPSPSLHSEGS